MASLIMQPNHEPLLGSPVRVLTMAPSLPHRYVSMDEGVRARL
jgi:hypothetical protein